MEGHCSLHFCNLKMGSVWELGSSLNRRSLIVYNIINGSSIFCSSMLRTSLASWMSWGIALNNFAPLDFFLSSGNIVGLSYNHTLTDFSHYDPRRKSNVEIKAQVFSGMLFNCSLLWVSFDSLKAWVLLSILELVIDALNWWFWAAWDELSFTSLETLSLRVGWLFWMFWIWIEESWEKFWKLIFCTWLQSKKIYKKINKVRSVLFDLWAIF